MITTFSGPHRFLSNFYAVRIVVAGVTYPTVEHAYQAAKCNSAKERETIRKAPTAAQAKRLGRTVALRPDWDAIKVDVMLGLLTLKFQQPGLRALLLATGDQPLVEGNTWGDRIWGQCPVGVGQNLLGVLLMEVRAGYRESL